MRILILNTLGGPRAEAEEGLVGIGPPEQLIADQARGELAEDDAVAPEAEREPGVRHGTAGCRPM